MLEAIIPHAISKTLLPIWGRDRQALGPFEVIIFTSLALGLGGERYYLLDMSGYQNQIICGNTLATLRKLPDEIVDLSITSPPYNKQEKNNGRLVKRVVYETYKDQKPETDYQADQIAVLNEAHRATKPGGSFFYNHKLRYLDGVMIHPLDWLKKTKWLLKQEIIWDRTIAGNIRGWRFWQVEERIFWLYKPVDGRPKGPELDSADAKLTSIWRGNPEGNNPHPAPFPLWLPARIIISLLKDPGLVCDPYSGSGTTLVAAKLLGHDYLGIDLDQSYCQMAADRLAQAQKEQPEIDKEKDLHQVVKSYDRRKKEAAAKQDRKPN